MIESVGDDGMGGGEERVLEKRARWRRGGTRQSCPQKTRLEHNISHLPFCNWCAECGAGPGRAWPHRTRNQQGELSTPEVHTDFRFILYPGRSSVVVLVAGTERRIRASPMSPHLQEATSSGPENRGLDVAGSSDFTGCRAPGGYGAGVERVGLSSLPVEAEFRVAPHSCERRRREGQRLRGACGAVVRGDVGVPQEEPRAKGWIRGMWEFVSVVMLWATGEVLWGSSGWARTSAD